MGLLPDEKNPLLKKNSYDELNEQFNLGIDPYDTEETISKALKKISLDKLPADERAERLESIKKLLKTLKNPSSRVRLNTFVLDKVDSKSVKERLQHLPSLKTEDVKLPQPDLSQVFIEGHNLDIAKCDFTPVEENPDLEIDFNDVESIMQKSTIEKHILFEV